MMRRVRNGAPLLALALSLGTAPAWAGEPHPAPNERRTQAQAQLSGAAQTGRLYTAQMSLRKHAAWIYSTNMWQMRANQAVRFAIQQRGKPYIWGGTGPHGFDCSGLVWRAWGKAGVRLPRTAADQYRGLRKKGKRVRREDLRPGDLIFFHRLGHVGMYVGNDWFVHAPRRGVPIGMRKLTGHYRRSYVGAMRPGWPQGLGKAQ